MKEIKLTRGMVALVDDEDYDFINNFTWHSHPGHNTFYARNSRKEFMHQLVMDTMSEMIDHINSNGLINIKSNLRIANIDFNSFNKRINSNNTSGFKGVGWRKSRNKWIAYIGYNRKLIRLGHFNNKIDAAIAYDDAAKKLYGEFANLNFT